MARSTLHEMPVLRKGSHGHPHRGGCLMEVTATLPGGPWTAAPTFVDPRLTVLARAVNDHTSEPGRRALLWFAPWLVGPSAVDRDAIDDAVVELAERILLGRPVPVERRRRRRLDGLIWSAAQALSRDRDADAMLAGLLLDAVNVTRRITGLPALPDRPTTAYPATLPVRVELCRPDGAESLYYHCTAAIERWPVDLRRAWQDRVCELQP